MSNVSWAYIASLAKECGSRYPELCAAQFALESAWGSVVSGKNNFFGIKGKGTKKKTTEFINGKEVETVEEFMDFSSPKDCINYLVERWYKDYGGRYKGVNNAANRNEAAKMLVSEGYATDPGYAAKLINLMNTNTVPLNNTNSQPMSSDFTLKNAAKHYKGLPHQDEAWEGLQKTLTKEQLNTFANKYRSGNSNQDKAHDTKFPLDVRYFYQRDSKTGHGERSCQSSAIAMVIEYLKPDLIADDDEYLNIVFRYGDTVAQSAHAKALDSLGVKGKFHTDGSEANLLKLLDNGIPVPIGILHKGPVDDPTGGGHYITVIGYDQKYFYVHDPFGELDLINGGYPKAGPTDGKCKKYTRSNLMKRWLIQSNSDGWYWDLNGN